MANEGRDVMKGSLPKRSARRQNPRTNEISDISHIQLGLPTYGDTQLRDRFQRIRMQNTNDQSRSQKPGNTFQPCTTYPSIAPDNITSLTPTLPRRSLPAANVVGQTDRRQAIPRSDALPMPSNRTNVNQRPVYQNESHNSLGRERSAEPLSNDVRASGSAAIDTASSVVTGRQPTSNVNDRQNAQRNERGWLGLGRRANGDAIFLTDEELAAVWDELPTLGITFRGTIMTRAHRLDFDPMADHETVQERWTEHIEALKPLGDALLDAVADKFGFPQKLSSAQSLQVLEFCKAIWSKLRKEFENATRTSFTLYPGTSHQLDQWIYLMEVLRQARHMIHRPSREEWDNTEAVIGITAMHWQRDIIQELIDAVRNPSTESTNPSSSSTSNFSSPDEDDNNQQEKRRPGRPAGSRNKATLAAEAKAARRAQQAQTGQSQAQVLTHRQPASQLQPAQQQNQSRQLQPGALPQLQSPLSSPQGQLNQARPAAPSLFPPRSQSFTPGRLQGFSSVAQGGQAVNSPLAFPTPRWRLNIPSQQAGSIFVPPRLRPPVQPHQFSSPLPQQSNQQPSPQTPVPEVMWFKKTS
ncbi:hypothetical protein LTS08_005706 [Lithohypha guttulata]|nr:hypothetical protein LTS08_005706 [Lithohypha guttulata]